MYQCLKLKNLKKKVKKVKAIAFAIEKLEAKEKSKREKQKRKAKEKNFLKKKSNFECTNINFVNSTLGLGEHYAANSYKNHDIIFNKSIR